MNSTQTLVDVPPLRLGRLLRSARLDAEVTLEDLVARGAGTFTLTDLMDIEAGRRGVDRDELDELIASYGVEETSFVPERTRLVIDLDENVMRTDGATVDFEAADEPQRVLARYLGLVYSLRDIEPGTPIPLRDVDVTVLSKALLQPPDSVESSLRSMMAEPHEDVVAAAKGFRARKLLPMAGVVIGAAAFGAIIAVANGTEAEDPAVDPPIAGEVDTTESARVDIGPAPAVVTRDAEYGTAPRPDASAAPDADIAPARAEGPIEVGPAAAPAVAPVTAPEPQVPPAASETPPADDEVGLIPPAVVERDADGNPVTVER